MQTHADEIRDFARRYVEDARRLGLPEATIVAGQIVKELRLNNRVPAVCSALSSKKFQRENHIVLARKEGPESGQSTTTRFVYKLSEVAGEGGQPSSSFLTMRGAGKATFEALGGGEAFISSEREEALSS